MELRENMCILILIFPFSFVDTTSILKLVFPTVYWFCLGSHLSNCVVTIIVVTVLFFFSVILNVILIFVYGHNHYGYFCYNVGITFCVWLLLLT